MEPGKEQLTEPRDESNEANNNISDGTERLSCQMSLEQEQKTQLRSRQETGHSYFAVKIIISYSFLQVAKLFEKFGTKCVDPVDFTNL